MTNISTTYANKKLSKAVGVLATDRRELPVRLGLAYDEHLYTLDPRRGIIGDDSLPPHLPAELVSRLEDLHTVLSPSETQQSVDWNLMTVSNEEQRELAEKIVALMWAVHDL